MKYLFYVTLFFCALSINSQNKQREITEFIEKWRLNVSDMKTLDINSLPGNLNLTGTNTNELKISAHGPDTHKLTGGTTELGFIISKNKRGNYRIQGIVDNSKNFNVVYDVQIPSSVVIKIQSGSRVKDSSTWTISKMKSAMKLEKTKGDIVLRDVQNVLTILNNNGNVDAQFLKIAEGKPNSIAASGSIKLNMPSESKATLEMNLYRQLLVSTNKELRSTSSVLKEGDNMLKTGKYTYNTNGGGGLFLLYAYYKPIHLIFN